MASDNARRRGGPDAGAADAVNQEFLDALAGARLREARWRPLIDGLGRALALADDSAGPGTAIGTAEEDAGPIDPDVRGELAAQARLSPYLRRDLRVIVDRFAREAATLEDANQAAALLAAEPTLRADPEAVCKLVGLFWGLDQAAGLFTDYPLVEGLFRRIAAPPPPIPPAGGPPDAGSAWFTDAPREAPPPTPTASFWRWPRWIRRWLDPAEVAPTSANELEAAALFQSMAVVPLTLSLGADLVPLIDPAFGGDLLARFQPRRQAIAFDSGFIVPGIRIVDDFTLRPNAYRVLVRLDVVAQGTLLTGYQLAVRPEDHDGEDADEASLGFPAADPATGRPGVWVAGAEAARAVAEGYGVRDATDVILDHVEATIRRQAHALLALDDVGAMLAMLREHRPEVANTVPYKLDLAELHQVLRLLLREQVSIRDFEGILEGLNHHLTPTREPPNLMYNVMVDTSQQFIGSQIERVRANLKVSPEDLAEVVRRRLSRQICQALADADGVIEVIELKPQVEDMVLGALKREGASVVLALRPDSEERLMRALTAACAGHNRPVLLCDAGIRAHVRRLAERVAPDVAALARDEVHPAFRLQPVGTVTLADG